MTRRKITAANWKMNGSVAAGQSWAAEMRERLDQQAGMGEVVLFPPFPYLGLLATALVGTDIRLGGQNMHAAASGAFTGEVSGAMLRDLGCAYVLVGHSERRALFGEDNRAVAEKFVSAQRDGLVPVLCVGETLAERDGGMTFDVVKAQIQAVIEAAGLNALQGSILAYEPVWAIGTGRTATPEQAQAVHAAIRGWLAERSPELAAELPILYGGSVKPDNAAEIFSMPDVDGGLIGGASLSATDFFGIVSSNR